MSEKELEDLAKWAANKLNGGNWYDENFYKFEHKKAWMEMISELIEKVKK